jgi:hypothetical protein
VSIRRGIKKHIRIGHDIYYLNEDFFKNSGYKHDWEFYIKHNSLLKSKADEIQKGQADIISLLNSGQELVLNHDRIITSEYERSSFEMSLYEREIEIEQITEGATLRLTKNIATSTHLNVNCSFFMSV